MFSVVRDPCCKHLSFTSSQLLSAKTHCVLSIGCCLYISSLFENNFLCCLFDVLRRRLWHKEEYMLKRLKEQGTPGTTS